ncbi:polysaccharide deacetylase [Paenibacillus sp. J22TS3]|uniref:polysaccharide deacetylase n=1 Tax=Paenibacillus sp. J22TS3 TaxID=2807192 RepID=UPI001B0C93EE|nr:polysaccharide deacetylase family protein [Paenibacillus sp. J22TS3]GIP23920.1 hypothetical protein J22TS3_41950 [Paenibacillus sp. J22TS3]
MYKKITAWCALVFCLVFAQTAAAAGSYTAVLGINDDLAPFQPEMKEGTYYTPVRDLASALGLKVSGTSEEILLTDSNSNTLLLKPAESKAVKADGTVQAVKIPVSQGKTLVPVALIARDFGYIVSYQPGIRLLRLVGSQALLSDQEFTVKFDEAVALNKAKNTQTEKEIKAEKDRAAQQANKGKQSKPVDSSKNGQVKKPVKQTAKQPVYLTFDDGPTAHTGQLLNILNKYDAKATFFMLGNHMDTYSAAVKRLVQEGHQVGLHGMTHVKNKFYKSPASALQEMEDDNAHLYKAAQVKTSLVRSPYGSKPYLTQSFRDKLVSKGYHIWDWNVDSLDWKYKSNSKAIYNGVMKQVHAQHQKGAAPIILMHDQVDTLKVLPSILAALKKEGYSFELITSDMTPHNFWHDER